MNKEIKSTVNDPLKGRIIRESKTLRKNKRNRKIFKRIKNWNINNQVSKEISSDHIEKDIRFNSDEIETNKQAILFIERCICTTENKLSYLKESLKDLENIKNNLENWKNVLSDLKK